MLGNNDIAARVMTNIQLGNDQCVVTVTARRQFQRRWNWEISDLCSQWPQCNSKVTDVRSQWLICNSAYLSLNFVHAHVSRSSKNSFFRKLKILMTTKYLLCVHNKNNFHIPETTVFFSAKYVNYYFPLNRWIGTVVKISEPENRWSLLENFIAV